jgi:hypothetical protein
MNDGSGGSGNRQRCQHNNRNNASATRMLVQVHNGGKDASNRGNLTGKIQPAQQKDERADMRSGAEDATQGDWVADDTARGGGLTTQGDYPVVASSPPDNTGIGMYKCV